MRKKCLYFWSWYQVICAYWQQKSKDIFIIGEGPTQGLYDTTLTAEAIYPINLHNQGKDLYQVYTIMEAIVSYSLMLQKYINSKQNTLKWKIMHCVEVITQKILQLIIWENKVKRKSNFFLFILILLMLMIF